MQLNDTLAIGVSIVTLAGALVASVRWMVKSFLRELVPNGGASIKDQVNRLEAQVTLILEHLLNNK